MHIKIWGAHLNITCQPIDNYIKSNTPGWNNELNLSEKRLSRLFDVKYAKNVHLI